MHQNNKIMKYVRIKMNEITDKIDASIIKPKVIVLYDSVKFPEFKYMIKFIENLISPIDEVIDYSNMSSTIKEEQFIKEIIRIRDTYTTHIALFAGMTSNEGSIAQDIIGNNKNIHLISCGSSYTKDDLNVLKGNTPNNIISTAMILFAMIHNIKNIKIIRSDDVYNNDLIEQIRIKSKIQGINIAQDDIIINDSHIPYTMVDENTILFAMINNISLQNTIIKNRSNINGIIIGTEYALPFDSRTLQKLDYEKLYIMLPSINNITSTINNLYDYIYNNWEYGYNRPIHPIIPFIADLIFRIKIIDDFQDLIKPINSKDISITLVDTNYTSPIGNLTQAGCWFMNARPYNGDMELLRKQIGSSYPTLNDSAFVSANIGYYLRDGKLDWYIYTNNMTTNQRKYLVTSICNGKYNIDSI